MEAIAEAVAMLRNATCPGDHDQAWELVTKATQDLESASALAFTMVRSADAVDRKVGCDLLGSLVERDESLREPVLLAALELAASETDHAVHASIARTLGRTGDERALPELLRLAAHPDADVRQDVAASLPLGVDASEPVIEALIRLSADADDDVRNWATFALGQQCQADGTAIRAALWARVDDAFGEVREEAIAGLARRRDARVVPYVARLLETGAFYPYQLTAFSCLAEPALLPYLREYEEDEGIVAALRACDPEARGARDAFAADLAEALHDRAPDLGFGVFGEVCEPGLVLAVAGGGLDWSLEPLYDRAGGDPARAAEMIIGALPGGTASAASA